jgi:XTP/dITP diphosphohydrolase
MKLYFVTGNSRKFNEVKDKLLPFGFEVIQHDIGYPEIQAESLEEVAHYGVDCLEDKIDHPFIIEDAGLFIEVLKGFPGVYSSYIFYTIGLKGILKLLDGKDKSDRKAVFRSVVAYKEPDVKPIFFAGECYGTISHKEIGTNGFGYDPIFIPDEDTRTFGQMKVSEKNCFSHRARSIEKLLDFFKKQ